MRTSSGSGSVGNLEHVALVRPCPAGADDAPERAGDPPLLADHLPDVVRRDVEVEDDRVLTLLGLDANGVGLVDEPLARATREARPQASAVEARRP